jgi:hypothetical protein
MDVWNYILVVPTTDQIPNNSGPCWQLGQPLLGSSEVDPTLVGPALAGPTTVVAHWTPRPTIIGLGGRARLNKLGSWQKDPTVGHPFGPNDAR